MSGPLVHPGPENTKGQVRAEKREVDHFLAVHPDKSAGQRGGLGGPPKGGVLGEPPPMSTHPSLGPDLRIEALEISTPRGGRRPGSLLPEATQEVVAGYLRAGCSISETARRLGLSRDRVRTVKYAMFGLTLAEYRTLKRELRDG